MKTNKRGINILPKELPDDSDDLEKLIAEHEANAVPLKQGNEAKIVWYEEERKETPFSIVYLHGFKGSRGGGAPVHKEVAQALGCNLYLARLASHGEITDQPLADLTAQALVHSAEDAYRVGAKIGKKVILMGTSAGGGLALYLAGTAPFSKSIAAIVLYSPLIHIYGRNSLLLEHSLGRRLLRLFVSKEHRIHPNSPPSPEEERVWYSSFHINGALAIGEFVQKKINLGFFQRIQCPTFIGYYFKDKFSFDHTVSVAAIKRMAKQLGTPPSKILLANFPGANSHVICSSIVSDAVKEVSDSTINFLKNQLSLSRG